jgi:hypothetical protein
VFGGRKGVGPLVVMPDTCILIEVREYLDQLDDKTGMLIAPNWSSLRDRIDAVQDLVQLWWSRDVRFAVSSEHLADGELNEQRQLAREAAVRELGRDYWERGGLETFPREEEELAVVDCPCARHAVPTLDSRSDSVIAQKRLWPKHVQDRRLAEAAFDAGCHVFLTAEKDILKRCHESLFAHGMAVLSPTQLIDALARSGELESDFGRHSPAPDLSTLSVLYAGFPEA